MNKIKKYILMSCAVFSLASCQDQLDIKNPNAPTPQSAATESGIISLGLGGVYGNGFRDLKYFDGVNGRFWAGAIGFHEIMADVVGMEAANQFANQIGCPDMVTLDNGTKVLNPSNPSQQIPFLRSVNINSNAGANPTYFEWAYMYSLNNACNTILDVVESVKFTGDAAVKTNVLKAWCYWWKGFAYSRIGSMYYAGLINNTTGTTNNKYVTKEDIIKEANANLDKAATILGGLTATADYRAILGGLIPDYCQKGKGGILAPDMWVRNINTLKARNILVNTPTKSMTAAQWTSILELANNGVKSTDLIFTSRSGGAGDNDFMSASAGSVIAKTLSAKAGQNTYKLSERLVQEFKPEDKRFQNNFTLTATWVGDAGRGNAFNTRYALIDGGKGMAGVVVYGTQSEGLYELAIAGNYEENELMKAEANLYLNKQEDALKIIDAVRTSQGAGLAATAGTGLSLDAAKEEFRRERRVTCAWRGLSFYDARRWGVLENGRTNAVIIDKAAVLNTKATINYNYLDYFDVPDNELAYNKPDAASAPVKNPK
ncbi:RagB/SusD family nutrient uptake outer membrane protein [Arcicella sp. LKC2W]|uniref:RagB/SusD family nutrient uptake outer membrane protein n=1 Tax=Arcicella sp. LKC2W TaxID=2984198 RepID=UPI002B1F3287|nr:RagB/SusD family nutrient uptake outer membrane protein [Arcicella sp. LKC2W]MEA5460639.1 RagB/SusD family nutrient uptake outer membrane protein [Arcicella sp. LKC2W]